MAGLYVNLAEYCKRYFSSDSAVLEMLEEFVPLAKQEMIPTAVSLLISFLPLDKANLYMPALFKIWEATNSNSGFRSCFEKSTLANFSSKFSTIAWWSSSARSRRNTSQLMVYLRAV